MIFFYIFKQDFKKNLSVGITIILFRVTKENTGIVYIATIYDYIMSVTNQSSLIVTLFTCLMDLKCEC